jgi:hypothetical protein
LSDVLQAVENTLIEAGYDDFMVSTERGLFRWQTTDRARQADREKWLPGDFPGAVKRDGG